MSLPTTTVIKPPSPAGLYNDGNLPYGAAVLTILANNAGADTQYDTDDFSLSFPSRRIERTNRYGVPNAAALIAQTPTGSCTAQIATNTTVLPAAGNVVYADITGFTADATPGQGWIIDDVSPPFQKENYLVCRLTFHAKLN